MCNAQSAKRKAQRTKNKEQRAYPGFSNKPKAGMLIYSHRSKKQPNGLRTSNGFCFQSPFAAFPSVDDTKIQDDPRHLRLK
jgi:hypothetical protein